MSTSDQTRSLGNLGSMSGSVESGTRVGDLCERVLLRRRRSGAPSVLYRTRYTPAKDRSECLRRCRRRRTDSVPSTKLVGRPRGACTHELGWRQDLINAGFGPTLQTQVGHLARSETCQLQTHAPQQTAPLFEPRLIAIHRSAHRVLSVPRHL